MTDQLATTGALLSSVRHGMQIDWDVPIEMDDGVVLRCDVYRPVGEGNTRSSPAMVPTPKD